METHISSQKQPLAIELYHSDALLENQIQEILSDRSLSKKRKRQRLRALEKSSSNAHLRSHVRYYLDLLTPRRSDIILNTAAALAIAAFFAYTVLRIVQNF